MVPCEVSAPIANLDTMPHSSLLNVLIIPPAVPVLRDTSSAGAVLMLAGIWGK